MNSFVKSEAGINNNGVQQLAIQDTFINSFVNEQKSAGKKRKREQEEEVDENLGLDMNDPEDHFLEVNNNMDNNIINNNNNNINNNNNNNSIVNNEEVIDDQDDDLQLVMNEPEDNFLEENIDVEKNIANNEEQINDIVEDLRPVDDNFEDHFSEENINIVDNGIANNEENQNQPKTSSNNENEILVYEFFDTEMRVVGKEYQSELILTEQEQFDQEKLEENDFLEGKIPVKCQNLKYRIKSGDAEQTYIQGWLCKYSGAVYFIGNLGQLLKCSKKQFMKVGGLYGHKSIGQGMQTNFEEGIQNYSIGEYQKIQSLDIPKFYPPFKKQKLEKNSKNKAQIEQGSSSKLSEKQTKKNSDIIDQIKREIQQILQDKNDECQKNRSYMAEKLLEKFQDLEVVKKVVWCEEHKIFLWFKNQGEVFYCPECKYHENELREQVLEKQQQNSKFSEQVKKFETQEQNNFQIVEKFEENIQTEQKKLQKIVDDYEKKIGSIQSQKEQAQKQVQNAIQQKQKLKEEEKQSKKSIKELWGQISQCQLRSTRSFDQ